MTIRIGRIVQEPRDPLVTGKDFEGGSLDNVLHWQIIWIRVIAKAWADDTFKEELKHDPRATIEKYFNYRLSEELDLTIVDAERTPGFDINKAFHNKDTGAQDPWAGLPRLKLEMAIPPAPQAEHRAIALSAYADTGRSYPFTCC